MSRSIFRTSRRQLGRLGILAVAASLVVGCLSPTLPLPPPSRPDVSAPSELGITTIAGRVPQETTAFVENLATGKIAGQTTDDSGQYEVELPATSGDRLAIWYREGTTDSDVTVVSVPKPGEETNIDGVLPPLGAAGAASE